MCLLNHHLKLGMSSLVSIVVENPFSLVLTLSDVKICLEYFTFTPSAPTLKYLWGLEISQGLGAWLKW
jgi:hypothetical protein